MDYRAAWDKQEEIFNSIISAKIQNRDLPEEQKIPTENYFLFCEHPHVYTLGKSGKHEHLLLNKSALEEKGATFYNTNRGGDITYHGPGQVVGYPIFDLENFFTDIHLYMRSLEEIIIITLKDYGIEAGRIQGSSGVWLDSDDPLKARKICAMGVRCSRWVTMHGFAFNVNNDLSYFDNIVPCGITDKSVTSLKKELGEEVSIIDIKQKIKQNFLNVFLALPKVSVSV